jgi:lysyl-tRNA synthetase class 2
VNPTDWQPSASLAVLKARAGFLAQIRDFFRQREVLEVDTPLLGTTAGTDVQLSPVPAWLAGSSGTPASPNAWLQTSPEFPMKRLLAAGSGPIYQICKAFRNGDVGRRHNPEFTLLEWYRPGFTLAQLMDEVFALVSTIVDLPAPQTLTYREAFLKALNMDPFTSPISELKTRSLELSGLDDTTEDRDFWLDLLYTHAVEQILPSVCFLIEYPASQAALARCETDDFGNKIARRFELIVNGVELANGYDELCDADEQRSRFKTDLEKRSTLRLPEISVDERFLQALEAGLPPCCGVALGLDRLFMLALGKNHLAEVLGFDISRV